MDVDLDLRAKDLIERHALEAAKAAARGECICSLAGRHRLERLSFVLSLQPSIAQQTSERFHALLAQLQGRRT